MIRFFRMGYYSWLELQGHIRLDLLLISKLINPLFTLLFFVYFVQYAYPDAAIEFLILGNALLMSASVITFNIASIFSHERQAGTLSLIIASPVSRLLLFSSKSIGFLLDALLVPIISIGCSLLFFESLHFLAILMSATLIFSGIIAAFCLGVLLSVSILLISENMIVTNTSWVILVAFSGVHIPPNSMPELMEILRHFLPMAHAIDGLRSIYSISSISWTEALLLMGHELLLAVIFVVSGYYLLAILERRAKVTAKLDLE